MYAVIGRVKIKPGHEVETVSMIRERERERESADGFCLHQRILGSK